MHTAYSQPYISLLQLASATDVFFSSQTTTVLLKPTALPVLQLKMLSPAHKPVVSHPVHPMLIQVLLASNTQYQLLLFPRVFPKEIILL